jgi:hypothetical protein
MNSSLLVPIPIDTLVVYQIGEEIDGRKSEIRRHLLHTEREPATLHELGGRLSEEWAGLDPEAAAAAVRNKVPLVKLPPRGIWGGEAVRPYIRRLKHGSASLYPHCRTRHVSFGGI